MPRMHNEETDLHKPLCFAINRSWLFKWFTRSSSDMYGDTLGNISSGLFSVERNGEIHGINLKLYCDLQYSYDVIIMSKNECKGFIRGSRHRETDESTRPQAECFYCFNNLTLQESYNLR